MARNTFNAATSGGTTELRRAVNQALESLIQQLNVERSNDRTNLVVTSPDGTRYRITVADDGTLSTVAV